MRSELRSQAVQAGGCSWVAGSARRGSLTVVQSYPQERFEEPYLALTAAASDLEWACGTAVLTDRFSSAMATYAYEFDDPDFVFQSALSPVQGASHSADLPFLFEAVMFGRPISPNALDASQSALAQQMVQAWGAFIEEGAPNIEGVEWERYTAGTRSMLRLVPGHVEVTTDFRTRHLCDAWGFSVSAP